MCFSLSASCVPSPFALLRQIKSIPTFTHLVTFPNHWPCELGQPELGVLLWDVSKPFYKCLGTPDALLYPSLLGDLVKNAVVGLRHL